MTLPCLVLLLAMHNRTLQSDCTPRDHSACTAVRSSRLSCFLDARYAMGQFSLRNTSLEVMLTANPKLPHRTLLHTCARFWHTLLTLSYAMATGFQQAHDSGKLPVWCCGGGPPKTGCITFESKSAHQRDMRPSLLRCRCRRAFPGKAASGSLASCPSSICAHTALEPGMHASWLSLRMASPDAGHTASAC